MTKLQWPKGSQPLDPNEWDFRGLVPGEFDAALRYEIAREHPQLDQALKLLTPATRKKLGCLSKEDWDNENHELGKGDDLPPRQYYHLLDVFHACWCCGDFPSPWMSLDPNERRLAVSRFGKHEPVRIISRAEFLRFEESRKIMEQFVKDRGEEVSEDYPQGTTRRYIIDVDWATDDTVLGRAFLKLLALRPRGTRPLKPYTGKRAAAVHAHPFKQLAAFRLARKAKILYKEVSDLIEERKETCLKRDDFKMLPKYSKGGWSDAVAAGEALCKARFQAVR